MKPLIKQIETDLDAFDIYTLFKNEKETALLDSSKKDSSLSEYSILGIYPFLKIKYENSLVTISSFDSESNIAEESNFNGDVFKYLQQILDKYKIDSHPSLPFTCGGIGYLSYDLARKLEVIPEKAVKDLEIPDMYINFYDSYVILDHINNKVFICTLGILKEKNERFIEIKNKILKGKKLQYSPPIKTNTIFKSDFSKEDYLAHIERVRAYIKSGDIYITNLTQRFNCKTYKAAYDIYKDLRFINPAPFSSFLNFEDFSIISSSPERFLKIRNGFVETRPIKGTSPRGATKEEDIINKNFLKNSEKDKSELLMIVDLERNDLSKVCKPHSVKVTELFKIEEYSTVFHLVSTIIGELKHEMTAVDCMKACFPGGSITGAPKIRSMEIIDELEKTRRSIYTGCIGYFGFDGNADFNIVIRTIVLKDNRATFGVGGGITWESIKEAEYSEILDKAKALMKVL
ncbi:aminodeoxychorismate synthase component I [Clostridium sp. SYSU_GA19001]|uniref:aminodeoxychorismate synthase component I n=1 Tax=Clostridium caldaquaticum TaxID=2940653 RepID=UPI002076F524|nr:aminodeoxychorismate synthase component I [Clostridium caldaquaticum]MCM8710922.1 aminodeoxychorismate synthase component I [Clostridium caldaquaticum]